MTERRHQMSKNPQWYHWTLVTFCAVCMLTVGILGIIRGVAASSSFYPINDIVVFGLVVSPDVVVRPLGFGLVVTSLALFSNLAVVAWLRIVFVKKMSEPTGLVNAYWQIAPALIVIIGTLLFFFGGWIFAISEVYDFMPFFQTVVTGLGFSVVGATINCAGVCLYPDE